MKVEKKLFENAPLTSSNPYDLSSYFAIYDKEYSIDQGKTVYHMVCLSLRGEMQDELITILNMMEEGEDEGAYYINWFNDAACGTTIIAETKIIIKRPSIYPGVTGMWTYYPIDVE